MPMPARKPSPVDRSRCHLNPIIEEGQRYVGVGVMPPSAASTTSQRNKRDFVAESKINLKSYRHPSVIDVMLNKLS